MVSLNGPIHGVLAIFWSSGEATDSADLRKEYLKGLQIVFAKVC